MNAHDLASLAEIAGTRSLDEIIRSDGWFWNEDLAERMKDILMRICAHYLVRENRGKKALDPVADFHLNNGARLEHINWLADISEHGMQQSAGIMVNYLYKLSDIERNHELYCDSGNIATSAAVNTLLK